MLAVYIYKEPTNVIVTSSNPSINIVLKIARSAVHKDSVNWVTLNIETEINNRESVISKSTVNKPIPRRNSSECFDSQIMVILFQRQERYIFRFSIYVYNFWSDERGRLCKQSFIVYQ